MACMLYVVCKYIQHTRASDFFRLRSNAELRCQRAVTSWLASTAADEAKPCPTPTCLDVERSRTARPETSLKNSYNC